MLTRRSLLATAAATALASPVWAEARLGDDGLHKQDWFLDSFLDMPEDLADAAAEGKHLMVLIEQAGCPYCRELHDVNFAKAEIVDYLTAHFVVIQLDLWGSREVVDFDGEALPEEATGREMGRQLHPDHADLHRSKMARPPTFSRPRRSACRAF